jgi:tetratricopeptide (TPR) repeat protein
VRVAPVAPVAGPLPVAPAPVVVPEEAPAPAPVRAQAHAPRARAAVTRPVAEAPAVQERESPIVAESRLLADALTALRQRRDPQQALRSLDAYERRFPEGALALEAAAARIDALLALGRRGQALDGLEALPLARVPRGAELRVLRGELRAGRGRLDEAADDFTAVLSAGDAPAAVIERALYGRGSCRSRLGDAGGARGDLREVVRRFPNGAHARDAERALRD